ncbi:cytochrome c oxidase subunit II [Notoacmeibacter ruber]|uniref:Cytochrome B n=1 Tax=Notoacmeibacter ruber TaxID=2670375 RepID=A0A3L7JH92_9HYPH|nr:cytochrome c oxidase subunit II [Notoacmeibacter ruber]RLQ89539.1 cytochrome B [Notoacmeibacter ruber]
MRFRPKTLAPLVALPVSACSFEGPQSVLSPAGIDAEQLVSLFWFLLAIAVVLWLLMNGLFFVITRITGRAHSPKLAERIIIGGGIVFPVIGLAAILGYGLSIMPDQRAPGDGLVLKVTGERFWWRVEYWPEGAEAPIYSANEIRLPVGRRSDIRLDADKVIHSFWIPALAGKMDMFPGRETSLRLEPTKTGTYRGQCAEFCGESHALMAFQAVVMEEDAFSAWLEEQERDAAQPKGEKAERGRDLFMSNGCGACHAVRGTEAAGQVGPDLTHVGSRESLAAGILPNAPQSFAEWTRHAAALKPDVDMPSYAYLSADELGAIAHYLEGLQ